MTATLSQKQLCLSEIFPNEVDVGQTKNVLVTFSVRDQWCSGILSRTSIDLFDLKLHQVNKSGGKTKSMVTLHSFRENTGSTWIFRNSRDELMEGEIKIYNLPH